MRSILVTILAMALAAPAPALAQQLFDFNGQATAATAAGEVLTMVAVINNNGVIETPLPLDFANYEYTLVVSGLALDSVGLPDVFSGGTVRIYEDAVTAADFADMSTFTDGVVLLEGPLATFTRNVFGSLGAGSGYVDWTGGSHIDDLHPNDRLQWPFLVSINRSTSVVEAGYFENWNGKVEPTEPVVAADAASWGGVKSRF